MKKEDTRKKKEKGKEILANENTGHRVFHSRKHPRAPIEVEVEFFAGDRREKGTAKNISHGGIFIGSEAPLNRGENVHIKLPLEHAKEQIEVKGRVAWMAAPESIDRDKPTPGMGIEIWHGDERSRNAFADFVCRITNSWRMESSKKRNNDN